MQGIDKLVQTHERLVEAVEALTTGEDWRKMLDATRRFNAYSASNLMLIVSQRPDASRVAGYTTWKRLGRQVRAGEQGIAILAPIVTRGETASDEATRSTNVTETNGPERVVRGFRVVHVFDIEQTNGEPIPEVLPVQLEGDAPAELWERLAARLTADKWNLLRGDCRPANATTHFLSRTVVVGSNLSPALAVKALAHEVAHTLLHTGSEAERSCRGRVEVEAESVAFLVCVAAGLPTDGYSFPYVAHWAEGDVDLVRSTADRVLNCARGLLQAMGIGEEQLFDTSR